MHVHTAAREALHEGLGSRLAPVAGDDHADDRQAARLEIVDQLESVGIVGDAEVASQTALLDVAGMDAQEYLRVAAELLQELDLDVGIVAGEHPGRVVVIKELAAELEVQTAVEVFDTIEDGRLLGLQVPSAVEARLHQSPPSEAANITNGTRGYLSNEKGRDRSPAPRTCQSGVTGPP